jgi:hypothetical protein
MNHSFQRLKRMHTQGAVLCAATAMAGLFVAPAVGSHSSFTASSAKAPALKIKVGIRLAGGGVQARNGPTVQIFFTPNVVNVGTYTMVARNYDSIEGHYLSINGVTSRWMGPERGTAVMKVTFKRPGLYTATVHLDAFGGGSGFLKVVK